MDEADGVDLGRVRAVHVIESLNAVGEREVAGTIELDVDDVSLRGGDDDARGPALAFRPTRVGRNDLHACTAEGEIEDASVRHVREVEPDDLALSGVQCIARLTIDEQNISPPAHERVGGGIRAVWKETLVIQKEVVQ